ncbi:MAG: DUF547 domain-containing protein [Planctomycetota bacterium]
MKKLKITLCAVAILAAGALAFWKLRPAEKVPVKLTDKELTKDEAFPHTLWTKVLKKHSKDGYLRYKAVKDDPADLDAYLGYVAKFSPESKPETFPKREDRFAYAINAYNAYVVKGVIDHYPCESVMKIGSIPDDFFSQFEYPFGGKSYTLKAWENKAREEFGDPRIHFAVNCASIGCPRLPDEAFEPGRLEEQLARETQKFVNEERNVKAEDGKVKLSSIFKWYKGDFTKWLESKGKPPDLLVYLKECGRDVTGEIEFLPYDWGINDLK